MPPRTSLGGLPLVLLIGGMIMALVPQQQLARWLAPLGPQQQPSAQSWSAQGSTCQTMVNADQRLSRDQLTQFLSLSQGTAQAKVHSTIAPPHCTLSKAHQTKQREAYPLAFDPDTWFVVNYEQGSYTSYDFIFQK